MHEIWVVDDDSSLRWVVAKALELAGHRALAFSSAEECREALKLARPDVLVTDIRMKGEDGIALLAHTRGIDDPPPVIVMTAHSDFGAAVTAYEAGAFEYLAKPFDLDELTALVARALESRAKPAEAAVPAAAAKPQPPALLGDAPAMQEVFRAVGRLSRAVMPVLITGESGTGKELVARALHRHSPRANGPFVAINTAAIPAELLESELFGHERGAFTGAHARRPGRFEQAEHGALFLDEIGDMPLALQTRLLRVLAEGEYFRVGGAEPTRADVRVIAATHQDLETLVAEGRFREDLYHRINVVRLHMPALRERRQDIAALAAHFLKEAAAEMGVEEKRFTKEALAKLGKHPFPGNVRELKNLCRRLTALAPGRDLTAADLPAELKKGSNSNSAANDWRAELKDWARAELAADRGEVGVRAAAQMEQALIEVALEHTGGAKAEAAEKLGWGRNTLSRKLPRGAKG
jgi:two-component system nitrogen regulation response regulator GlnG